MKPLQNRRIFEEHRLALQQKFADGMEVYFRRDFRIVKSYPLLFERRAREPLYTMILYEHHCLKDMHYRRRNAAFFSMEVIWEGSLSVRLDDRMYLLEPGDCLLIHPYVDAELLTGPAGFCVKTSLVIDGVLRDAAISAFGLEKRDVLTRPDWNELRVLIQSLKELCAEPGKNQDEKNGQLTYRLFQLFLHPAETTGAFQRISGAAEYLEKHFAEPVSMTALAEMCGCSRMHLIRCFKQMHGISPYRMLTEIRMREAVRLLLMERSLSVKEVAERVGYARPLNFSAEFRKRFGVSPRAYRSLSPEDEIKCADPAENFLCP